MSEKLSKYFWCDWRKADNHPMIPVAPQGFNTRYCTEIVRRFCPWHVHVPPESLGVLHRICSFLVAEGLLDIDKVHEWERQSYLEGNDEAITEFHLMMSKILNEQLWEDCECYRTKPDHIFTKS